MHRLKEPLPRSLVPLADESLPGFLLRLAHRLGLPPGQLLWRTGLGGQHYITSRAPAAHLLMLEPALLNVFAESAGLSPDAADALTLRSYREYYPALAEALGPDRSAFRPHPSFPRWVLMASSRYCPLCLAGDGTPIQQRHGGPWKRQWRLAITFACLEHRVFLRHDCPGCQLPASSSYPGSPLFLLPAASTADLHPTQCRNSPSGSQRAGQCGHRLDTATPQDLPPDLADLQRRLLNLLDNASERSHAFQQFADLQVASALIQAKWPATAELAPGEVRSALARHIADQNALARDPWPQAKKHGRPIAAAWSTPPIGAAATAALLAASENLTRLDPSMPPHDLTALLHEAPTQDEPRWGNTWPTLARDSSVLFRQKIDRVFRLKFPDTWIRRGSPQQWITQTYRAHALFEPVITVQERGFTAEHIPQDLPASWFKVFADKAGFRISRDPSLKRTASIQMVQSVTGLDFLEAAEFLGIPSTWITQKPRRLHPLRLHARWRDYDFPAALEHLAEFIAHERKTDYQARRAFIAGWQLDDQAWEQLCHQYVSLPLNRTRPPARIRDSASALVWSRVTSSEYLLAPVFQPPLSAPDRQLDWRALEISALQRWDLRGGPNRARPSHFDLFEALEALAAARITEADTHAR